LYLFQTLADELLADTERTHYKINRLEEQVEQEELSRPASKQARDMACSILNMTSDDLEDFMKDDDNKVNSLYDLSHAICLPLHIECDLLSTKLWLTYFSITIFSISRMRSEQQEKRKKTNGKIE
jgi:hypothetical protein